mmetsp:Transcript_36961/g.81148  ORF Transcript_36961/g.81148 Transcript_36961/m.81148 type:complete len:401 (+) Transcript_36961:24-1226(+)
MVAAPPRGAGLEASLQAALERRRSNGLLRSLSLSTGLSDFSSNDYLGLARSPELIREIDAGVLQQRAVSERLGSTGSRLLTGNSTLYEEVESELAKFHRAESALIFNSGYDLNLGLFACVPQHGDIVIFDDLIHQSVREGIKLCRAQSVSFSHNDVSALRHALEEASQGSDQLSGRRNIIVAVESVYSMDGHCAPLAEFCDLVDAVGASLVVDEAHGTGVFGAEGRGWVSELGLEDRVFCRVHTFGKAVGIHGAAMVGPLALREYLVNYAWPLVYSTSLPTHSLISIRCAYATMRRTAAARQQHLRELIALFHQRLKRLPPNCALSSPSPIQGIIVPGNAECVSLAQLLQRSGFDVKPIRSPTVPAGLERLRIILHAHNTREEVNCLMDVIESAMPGARL